MILILAIFIIAISFVIFFYLFSNILLLSLFDIPATLKLKRNKIINHKPVLKKYILIVLICSVITLSILSLTFYFFNKYSFGFLISIYIGACFALLTVLWKMVCLFFHLTDHYIKWLDFYRKDNSQYLAVFDLNIINKALGGKPEDLDKVLI
ncbi:MAG: hypothetical protein KBB23_07595 [Smithella sp.]|jgi:amino acid transporter|nr:hypothetical protein [Smithella sp.]